VQVEEALKKIYVAGGSSERAQCAHYMTCLRKAGWEITHDWTIDESYREKYRSEVTARRSAFADMCGVVDAEYFWLVSPQDKSDGSSTELGIALGRGRRVIVSGPYNEQGRIFPLLAYKLFDKHEEALAWLVALATPPAMPVRIVVPSDFDITAALAAGVADKRSTPPPGTYGPGDHGPNSFRGSDYP
jgi:hypothetical protein